MAERIVYGSRASICPTCRRLLAGDLVEDEHGLHLEKACPAHGRFRTRIARSHDWIERLEAFSARAVPTASRQTVTSLGCPEDCGECPEHQQRGVFFLFEITDTCDLRCPICLGRPRQRGSFVTEEQMRAMVTKVVSYAGSNAIVTLGGGEPTAHPRFFEFVEIIRAAGVHDIWVYTNGRRIARDPEFADRCAARGLTVVLQWDGFTDRTYTALRGQPLLEEKQQAYRRLKDSGVKLGICATVAGGVNEGELKALYEMLVDDPALGILDLAPLAFVGLGEEARFDREHRITTQDIVESLSRQTGGAVQPGDFTPVSFPHTECLQVVYLLSHPDGGSVPLARYLDDQDREALLRHTPLLTLDAKAGRILRDAVAKLWAGGNENSATRRGLETFRHIVERLFPERPLSAAEFQARSRGMVKILWIHSYMDGLNFDLGRARKCISRTVLPDGRFVPSCVYNVVHRQKAEVSPGGDR